MDKIIPGIKQAGKSLGRGEESLLAAARGMMTTDTVHKLSGRTLNIGGHSVQLTGMAKGAAMIGPHMATMLGLILTDATLSTAAAQDALGGAVDETFNCISVEGHMSTNDTVLLLANGAAGAPPTQGAELAAFRDALRQTCLELARQIASDGEGATHLVTIDVEGCATFAAARQIARTVANSPLVKTAIAGADPNWGRILSAAGYSGIEFDPARVELRLNDFVLYQRGAPAEFDADQVSASIRDNRDTRVVLRFAEGDAKVRFWTTDLTAEYIRLNADYHT
jgi:glutamate N-acetyltransferase/amino-acid N-acetyltransferase